MNYTMTGKVLPS